MKILISITLFLILMASCAAYDPKADIEGLLEIELPNCYAKIGNPEKQNSAALEVVELKFEGECLDEFLNAIGEQSPAAYCGTATEKDLIMVFCTRDESARMTINTVSGLLHFEKLK